MVESLEEPTKPNIVQEREIHRELLKDVTATAEEMSASISSLMTKIGSEPALGDGISFLNIKTGLLLEYNMNLGYILLRKTRGDSIEGDKAVERLCYLRTLIEKIRPIENKLKYQIDKFVTIAETGEVRPDDPSRFKANPDMLVGKLDESDDSEEDDNEEQKRAGQKYVVPKNVPKHFDEDKSKEEIQAEQEKAKKKTALSHSMIRELKSQMLDNPEEISHESDTRKQKYIQREKEKTLYEEEMFIRLPVTKADRVARRQMSTVSNIGASLTSFGSSSYDGERVGGGKKRKGGEKGPGGKKKKFKIKKKKF